jgi:mono/diheme cytochrome c family protein
MRCNRSPLLAAAVVLTLILCGCRTTRGSPASESPSTSGPSATLTELTANGEASTLVTLPAGPGQELVRGNCVICHGVALIEQQRKDSAGWTKTITQMRAWGSPVAAEQVPALLAYLTAHYGTAKVAP